MNEDHQTVLPYGSWPSAITADAITAASVGLGGVTVDGPDVYWLESRPGEGAAASWYALERTGRSAGSVRLTVQLVGEVQG